MRPLLDEPVLPRTRSSLRVSHEGSNSKKEAAAWNASPSSPSSSSTWTRKRNHSSFSFLALAVAAGVALGLLFGARDALVKGATGVQSTLASELVQRLESQSSLLDYALAERDRLARLLGEAQARAREAQEAALGAAQAARALHVHAARGGAALAEAARERDAAIAEAEAARVRLSGFKAGAGAGAGTAGSESEGGGTLPPVDRHTPWRPSAARDERDPELASSLRRAANANGEVMVALCNAAYAGPGGMLSTWARTAVAAGVTNALVLAMDREAQESAVASGVAAFLLEEEWSQLPAAQQQQQQQRQVVAAEEEEKDRKKEAKANGAAVAAATNHSVSALKFKLLRRILALGYAVLLSDVDVVTLRNPFGFVEEEEEELDEREEEGEEEPTTLIGSSPSSSSSSSSSSSPSQEGEWRVGEEELRGGAEHLRRREKKRTRRRRRHFFLKRDSDFEAMSDGWDRATAYGFDDVLDVPSMGWSRYAHSTRVFALNSGLFFVRPTLAAADVLARVAARVASERGSWDQAVFNEVALLPSAEGYYAPAPRVRVMAIHEFMNSKVLFTRVRYELAAAESESEEAAAAAATATATATSSSSSSDGRQSESESPSSSTFPPPSFPLPAMVHVNYHPDKHDRMKGVVKFFLGGDREALDGFPDGSEW